MRKVLEFNRKTEILSFFGVILLFQPHSPTSLLLRLLFMEFVPRFFHKSYIALIFSSDKLLDKSICSPFNCARSTLLNKL